MGVKQLESGKKSKTTSKKNVWGYEKWKVVAGNHLEMGKGRWMDKAEMLYTL